jgi:5-methylcytosine-specific restriction endonuclease McrA
VIGEFHPQPKPSARVVDRVKAKASRTHQERIFRAAVWIRDGSQCRGCQKRLMRGAVTLLEAGHVHHRHGRNVRPEDRYNVKQAVLLCGPCHADPAVIARFRGSR